MLYRKVPVIFSICTQVLGKSLFSFISVFLLSGTLSFSHRRRPSFSLPRLQSYLHPGRPFFSSTRRRRWASGRWAAGGGSAAAHEPARAWRRSRAGGAGAQRAVLAAWEQRAAQARWSGLVAREGAGVVWHRACKVAERHAGPGDA
jgi:hypothetical protein